MNPLRPAILLLATVLLPSMALASEADVSPALRAQAEAGCRDDAFRLCADAIPNEAAILALRHPLISRDCNQPLDCA